MDTLSSKNSPEGGYRLTQTVKARPLVSIITVVRNGRKTLEKTITSVIQQTSNDLEHIVLDGGSKDGTIELLHDYNSSIAYWRSEEDIGIYNAMNKGIELAWGDWLFFLNADDLLHDKHVIADIAPHLRGAAGCVFGTVVYDTGEVHISHVSSSIKMYNTVHHQSAFYSARLLRQMGLRYDEKYAICADYELNLRLWLNSTRFVPLERVVSFCADDGTSRKNPMRAFHEMQLIQKNALGLVTSLLSFARNVSVYFLISRQKAKIRAVQQLLRNKK
ncbi:glycosyltransferase family 2 protein [Gloeobacter violaceus]|uniref:Glr3787 protein n=1 Tax=Gloeobacter violaceus (strain ATCC 29082 / PCC 7421) TaxID=251221 RepID=Q7NEU1_GLOVI|nr:glycosyltransferase family 2 protein [Gloeobacter violaceus]BAC91728.1 glr3787 [Gloeobacter violaceus PCC 7421]